jgi:surface protein
MHSLFYNCSSLKSLPDISEWNINNLSDNYLITHLDEYVQNEASPLPLNKKDNLNSISYTGFRLCSELTKPGKNENGNTKIDQDTPLISLSVGGIIGFNLFGVLDGHGVHGHFVSQFCKEYFIKKMEEYIELLKNYSGNLTAEQIYNELKNDHYNYIIELYNKSDTEIATKANFDYMMSGTTCNIVFQFNNHLVCFSVGDSRGILIYDKGDSKNEGIFPLSTDHKPNLPNECQRIKLYGGEVEQVEDMFGNKLGPARVFKAGFDYPGLAMSRSLGDLEAKECGVISTPQIMEYDINYNSKYMVICSDGVWEFITNEQVRDIGNYFYKNNDIAGFCTELIKFSEGLWEEKEIIRDDITVVSVFF